MKYITIILSSFLLLAAAPPTAKDVAFHRQRAAQMRKQAVIFADRAELLNHQADSLARVGDTIRARSLRERADIELGKSLSYIRSAAREDDKANPNPTAQH